MLIDTNRNVSAHLTQLKALGITAIGRYYSRSSAKRLTRLEAAAISNANIDLFTVFEDRGDPELTREKGVFDAQLALTQAEAIGQPYNSAIYFALDHAEQGGYTTAHIQSFKQYMSGIRDVLADHYKIGVYGDGVVCKELLDAQLCDYTWLSASTGRPGTPEFIASGWATLIQQRPVDQVLDGIRVDIDKALQLAFGAFRVGNGQHPSGLLNGRAARDGTPIVAEGRSPAASQVLARAARNVVAPVHYFAFAASEAWAELAGDLDATPAEDETQQNYARAVIETVAASNPGKTLMFGFDAGDVGPRDPDTDPDYSVTSGDLYDIHPPLAAELAYARTRGLVSLYVEGPGGATGSSIEDWSQDEVLRITKRCVTLVAATPNDPALAALKRALGTVVFEKLKGPQRFRTFFEDRFVPKILPAWNGLPWDGAAWWKSTLTQLAQAKTDGFAAAEIDNLSQIFDLDAVEGRAGQLRFFKETYKAGFVAGKLPRHIMKNLNTEMLVSIRSEIESGALDATMFADVHIFETRRAATTIQAAIKTATAALSKIALFSFNTKIYRAAGALDTHAADPARVASTSARSIDPTLVALSGHTQSLDLIARFDDTAHTVTAVTAQIVQLAKSSAIARYPWKDRGPASVGYTAGMAVTYASAYARLKAHDPVADRMARVMGRAFRDVRGVLQGDTLAWYNDEFDAIGLGASSPEQRLRRLFVLLTGLGMRESSGRYCEGRDRSVSNASANTAEAGLFQMSFDLLAPRAELLDVFHHYQAHPKEGFLDVFSDRVSPPPRPKDLENFGPPNSAGFAFQKLSKECPAMTVEVAALGLRSVVGHWGPLVRKEAQVRPECSVLFAEVERIVDSSQHITVAGEPIPIAARLAAAGSTRADVAHHYMERVELANLLPINKNFTNAREQTMISLLGAPQTPLTTDCQNERASPLVKRNVVTERMSPLFRLQGVKPAVDDVKSVLAQAFIAHPDLETVLSTEGMLCVRMRKPTNGTVSTHISNHSWGTAVDFKIVGFDAPPNTGYTVPRFIAILIPLFNATGWYSGVAFHDSMHFEVSEERIRKWQNDHVFA
jgi:Domain of unknown function (DUF1906)/D-alanyl-D-alanine carboxypeptidase